MNMSIDLTPKQKKNIKRLADLMDKGNVAVLEYLMELEDKLDTEIPSVKEVISRVKGEKGDAYVLTDKDKKDIASIARSMVNDRAMAEAVKSLIEVPIEEIARRASQMVEVPTPQDGKTPTKQELESIIKPLIPTIDINKVTTQVSGKVIEETKKLINQPDTAEDIRNKLELLKDEERLDVSAIKGIDKRDANIEQSVTNRAIGIVDQRTSYLINKVSNIQKMIDSGEIGGGGTPGTPTDSIQFNRAGAFGGTNYFKYIEVGSNVVLKSLDGNAGYTALALGDGTHNTLGIASLDIQTARASGDRSATGNHSIAIGEDNMAASTYSTVIGYRNDSPDTADRITMYGYQNYVVDGSNHTVVGYGNMHNGTVSGENGDSMFGKGNSLSSSSGNNIIVGWQNSITSSFLSSVFGVGNSLTGHDSGIFGESNIVTGDGSFAVGAGLITTGNGLFDIGLSNTYKMTLRDSDGLLNVRGAVRVGTTTDTTGGNIRWTGTDFEGYDSNTASWKSFTTSSVTNPAGSNTQIQFNDGGAFGADADFVYDKIANAMTITGGTGRSQISRGLLINASQDGSATGVFQVKSTADANLIYTDSALDRVGIGTATPAYKLDVNGTAGVSGIFHNGNIRATGSGGILFESNAGTDVALFGAGGGAGATFYGGVILSTMTQGSVLFAGSSGLISQDNANFFWDDTNNRLGIGTASPTSTLQIAGSFATAISVISTDTTLDGTHQIVIIPNGSTITLPTSVGISGRQYNIIRSGTSNVQINTTSSQTISGDTSITLTNQWDSVVVVSDGSNWIRCS